MQRPVAAANGAGVGPACGIEAAQARDLQAVASRHLDSTQIGIGLAGDDAIRLCTQLGAARDALHRRWPALGQCWQHTMTQEVAIGTVRGIARVFNPRQPRVARPLHDAFARSAQQRPRQPSLPPSPTRRHAAEATGPGAPQHLQQHGLGLVLLMMRGEQHDPRPDHGCDRGVAGLARGRFRALPVCGPRIDPPDLQRHTELGTACAAIGCPVGRGSLQTMVDMDRVQWRRQLRADRSQQVKQYTRIEAATERNPITVGMWQRVLEKVNDPVRIESGDRRFSG